MDRLVQHRAVEPDDMFDVVFDFGGIDLVQGGVVGRKMAVRDRLIVTGTGLMDVLRRQRRRERQEWHDEQQRSGASRPNHGRIIQGRLGGVNRGEVTHRSATGQ
jgi:hypothetical protein